MAFLIGETFLGGSFLSHSLLTLYLHFRTLMQKLFLLETTIHANLETRALFIALDLLNPKLPLRFLLA